MRTINYIVIHCTGTQPETTIESIKKYWKEVQKWDDPGYHMIIDKNGKMTLLHPLEKPSNGVKGFNKNSIHIAYIGGINKKGIPEDTRTDAQIKAIREVLQGTINCFPTAAICGHRDFPNVKKACPSFNAKREYANICRNQK